VLLVCCRYSIDIIQSCCTILYDLQPLVHPPAVIGEIERDLPLDAATAAKIFLFGINELQARLQVDGSSPSQQPNDHGASSSFVTTCAASELDRANGSFSLQLLSRVHPSLRAVLRESLLAIGFPRGLRSARQTPELPGGNIYHKLANTRQSAFNAQEFAQGLLDGCSRTLSRSLDARTESGFRTVIPFGRFVESRSTTPLWMEALQPTAAARNRDQWRGNSSWPQFRYANIQRSSM